MIHEGLENVTERLRVIAPFWLRALAALLSLPFNRRTFMSEDEDFFYESCRRRRAKKMRNAAVVCALLFLALLLVAAFGGLR